jgi:diguanylate cyclase (GGDEF)-like protein
LSHTIPRDRLASRIQAPASAGEQGTAPPASAEHGIVEWLLHDDQIMHECFAHAVAILRMTSGLGFAAVTLLDSKQQHYLAEAGFSLPAIPREQSICAHVVRQDEVLVVEDTLLDSRFSQCMIVQGEPHVRFYAGISIRAPGGARVGALCVMSAQPATLTVAQGEIMQHLRAMIDNDLALRSAAAVDPLTQLFNRRFMLESVQRRWQATAEGGLIGAVMVDIDHFKLYNDTYGHLAGDDCLRQVAGVIQAVADEHRLIAGRLGGEEFGLLLCDASEQRLGTALEALRAGVAELQIAHRRSSHGYVTVSIGALLKRHLGNAEPSPREGFALADEALYQAKDTGRNKVVVIS